MIDYKLLDNSLDYYGLQGFQRIELPWMVSEEVDAITRPDDKIPFKLVHNNKNLVASGEQSFLYLYLKNFLPKGSFQGITPCFRNESFDFLHSKYFMKNELIKTDNVTENELEKIINTCFNFYSRYFNKNYLEIVRTDIGFDIEVFSNELGSYGIRECKFLKWIYATGCAEPRTSNLIKLYGNGINN
jgi:hypothetical protein